MKVCYLLQTHKNPEQIYRLVKLIKRSSPNSQVIVSHDNKSKLDLETFEDLQGVQIFINKADGERGGFSIVQGYLDIVDWLFQQNIEFDWLINITGQDYPLQSISKIEEYLAETQHDGFLEYFKVFSDESHWSIREGYSRYFYKYHLLTNQLPVWQKELLRPLKLVNYLQPFFRINFAYGVRIAHRINPPFNEDFICYGGSFYCTLSRKCVQYIYDFCKSKSKILEYYKGVSNSDESFLQTVLVNNPTFNLCNDSKRYFDFSKTRHGHPRILTTDDYPALIQTNAHFARKFDIDIDSTILDLIDKRITQNPEKVCC